MAPTSFLIGIAAFIIVVGLGIWLLNRTEGRGGVANSATSVTASQSQSTNNYTVLSPATVPPKVAECSQSISFSSNGTSGPLQCSNGNLNVTEWESLAALEPQIMSLGYNVTTSQAESALCSDVHKNISNAIEQINFQISSLYYGWSFQSNPTVVLTNGNCVNKDD